VKSVATKTRKKKPKLSLDKLSRLRRLRRFQAIAGFVLVVMGAADGAHDIFW